RHRADAAARPIRRRSDPPSSSSHDRDPVLGRSASRPRGRESRAARRRGQERSAPLHDRRRPVPAGLGLLLLHQRRRAAVVRRRRVGTLRAQARGARLLPESVRAGRRRRGRDATDARDLPSARREPRRAVRRAGRRRVRGRDRRARTGSARGPPQAPAMNIGMVCYASVGGSGVVATELAHALARRGHHVHVISSEPPFRWRWGVPGLSFERVDVPPYPLFREPQYLIALANTIARVAEERRLDVVHAHYAVPHATAAYLADQMLAAAPGGVWPATVP